MKKLFTLLILCSITILSFSVASAGVSTIKKSHELCIKQNTPLHSIAALAVDKNEAIAVDPSRLVSDKTSITGPHFTHVMTTTSEKSEAIQCDYIFRGDRSLKTDFKHSRIHWVPIIKYTRPPALYTLYKTPSPSLKNRKPDPTLWL